METRLEDIERKHKDWFARLDRLLNERPWLRKQRILTEKEKAEKEKERVNPIIIKIRI